MSFLTSRRFWVNIAAVVCYVAKHVFGLSELPDIDVPTLAGTNVGLTLYRRATQK